MIGHPFLIDVVESGDKGRKNRLICEIGSNLIFNSNSLESYFFAVGESVLFDALLLAAAVEFCDKTMHRPAFQWRRQFDIRIPVHEPERWNQPSIYSSLHELLDYLTGDEWNISFSPRKIPEPRPSQLQLRLENAVSAVIPYSNGLDSFVVACLKEKEFGKSLIRIRLKKGDDSSKSRQWHLENPFTSIPFSVKKSKLGFNESSGRSRGFKFALIGGIAAHVLKATQVIVPESGIGAIGPALVPVGQTYDDYRCYPLFTKKMEGFLLNLLNSKIHYKFPQIWKTKGESLKEFANLNEKSIKSLKKTRSCWQQNRQVSVDEKARQCGVCAACMLRRLSLHSAGIHEPSEKYVWENLTARNFEEGAAPSFKFKKSKSMREYAIAGTLHLVHLAELLSSPMDEPMVSLRANQLAQVFEIDQKLARGNLTRLLSQHKSEWENFLLSLGDHSFVAKWARRENQ